MTLDIRDTSLDRRDAALRAIATARESILGERQVSILEELLNADAPAQCDAGIVEALTQSCAKNKLPFLRMVSRAYHDSLFMSRIAPVGMLFIPCRGGVSHRPDEYSSPEQIGRGVWVLARTLASLSSV